MNKHEYLSEEWRRAAVRAAQCLPVQSGLNLLVATQLGPVPSPDAFHEQRFEDGRLVAWTRGDSGEAAVLVKRSAPLDLRAHCRLGNGSAVARATVCAMGTGELTERSLPPLLGPRAHHLPFIAGATVTVTFHCEGSPCGSIDVSYRFVDGQLASEDFGTLEAPEVRIGTTYRTLIAFVFGRIGFADLLADGTMRRGTVEHLAILHGLFGCEELRPRGDDLALAAYFGRLGRLTSTKGYAAWCNALREFTAE